MATSAGTRLLKWLGDPPAVGEDLWRVPNWRYENRRTIALHHFASFKIEQSFIPGLSKAPNNKLTFHVFDLSSGVLLRTEHQSYRNPSELLGFDQIKESA
jgi:hypothetical protein